MRGRPIASATPNEWASTFTMICMIAPRRRVEPALPTTRRGPLAPSTIVGAIMLVSRPPARGGPPPTRSYSPSMLFRWTPVPGTTTPEPDPVEVESAQRCLPRRSPRRVSSPGRRPLAARRPDERRWRAARGVRREQPSRETTAVQTPGEPVRAPGPARASPRRARDRLGAPRRGLGQALQQCEPVVDQDASGRRRPIREHRVSPDSARQGRRQTTR